MNVDSDADTTPNPNHRSVLENDDQNPVVNMTHGYEDEGGFTIVTRRYKKGKAGYNKATDIAEKKKSVKIETAVNRRKPVKISEGKNCQDKRAKAHFI